MPHSKKISLALATVLIELVILEVVIRLCFATGLDPQRAHQEANDRFASAGMLRSVERGGLRYMGTPHATVTNRDIEYRHNSLGLRDREIAAEKKPGEYRILVLGDSNAYGWGVRQEETFCSLVEQRLNETRTAGGRRYEVINAAFPGYNTGDQEAIFRHLQARVEPDLVLLAWYVNDLERLGFHISWDGYLFCDPLPLPDVLKPLLWNSFAYRKLAIARISCMKRNGDYVAGQGENVSFSKERILTLRDEVASAGARFALLDVPWLEPGKGTPLLEKETYRARANSEWLAQIAARENIPLLPLINSVAGQPPAIYWYLIDPPDHHPNALAHRKFADAIYEFLVSEKLLP